MACYRYVLEIKAVRATVILDTDPSNCDSQQGLSTGKPLSRLWLAGILVALSPKVRGAPMPMETAQNRRGLLKLMLRMPALRGQLQILAARNEDVFSLCVAFDDASMTLEILRKDQYNTDGRMITEYERICSDIELEILSMCVNE